MPRASKGLLQAYQLQDLAFEMAQALRESMTNEDGKLIVRRDEYGKPVDAQALAQIGKVWVEAQERIAFHRRVPSPGSLKPTAEPRRKRPATLAQAISYADVIAPPVASDPPTS